MSDVIIVGAGGFGREVYHWANDLLKKGSHRFKGYIDDKIVNEGCGESTSNIIGTIKSGEKQYRILPSDRFICAIGNVDIKKRLVIDLRKRGANFLSLIHPTALIAETAVLGEGVVVCPFAIVSDDAIVSDFAMINSYASCAHGTRIGKYAILSPYATLNGHAEIEDEVFLGTHATVSANRIIGKGSKISANSSAMQDIPSKSIVFGVPGKHKRIFL